MSADRRLRTDAWRDRAAVVGAATDDAERWGLVAEPAPPDLMWPAALDESDIADPRIGWGLVLPDHPVLGVAAQAVAADMPQAVQELVRTRGPAPVLRWSAAHPRHLRRDYPDGRSQRLPLVGAPRGTRTGAVPRFLLICATPAAVPWSVQYALNADAGVAVGRLDLDDEGLTSYAEAVLGSWGAATARVERTLVWSVDHGAPDITELMRRTVADRVAKAYAADTDLELLRLTGPQATADRLADAVAGHRPSVVVVTSHGDTGPTGRPDPEGLGTPLDADHTRVGGLGGGGAIWYCHACCSAGCDNATAYDDLFAAGDQIRTLLDDLAGIGPRTAPLARSLLGGPDPARAVIGHVEPTFDRPLLDVRTGRQLTDALGEALHDQLFRRRPVGLALRSYFGAVGAYLSQLADLRDAYLRGADPSSEAFTLRLAALDRRSLVILGDPAVALPVP